MATSHIRRGKNSKAPAHHRRQVVIWWRGPQGVVSIDRANSQRSADRLVGEYRATRGDSAVWSGRKADEPVESET